MNERQSDFGWTVDLHQPTKSEEAKLARDSAVDKVGSAAESDGWLEGALEAIRSVAREKAEFSADDVWDSGLEPPRESRALGAAFTILRREKVIEPTSQFKTTSRARRHAAPIRVWRSLIKSSA